MIFCNKNPKRRFYIGRKSALVLLLFCAAVCTLPATLLRDPAPARATVTAPMVRSLPTSGPAPTTRRFNPDGSGDHLLWRLPKASHPADGLGTLHWRPDGAKLLVDSGHDWQRSMGIRDLYAIAPDGSRFRRVSSPSGPEAYRNYPTGTVTFVVDALEVGDVQIYIEGALEPFKYVARRFESYRITQTVADLGDGVRQYIRLWDLEAYKNPCNYAEDAWVDVVPGQFVALNTRQCALPLYLCQPTVDSHPAPSRRGDRQTGDSARWLGHRL